MQYKDYYKILGVSRDASQEEIKRVYRKLARKYHPDVSKEKDAEQRFKEIGEAYEVLKDSQKRAAYDQLGTRWQAGDEFQPPPGWNFKFDFGGSGFNQAHHFDFSDFFESLFGSNHGRHSQTGNPFSSAGKDEVTKLTLTLEEAFQGTHRAIQLQVPEMVGMGQIQMKTRTLNVKIPPGVTSGQKIRLAGQGVASGFGGESAGDLYLEIDVQPHRFYRLEGRDVYLTLPLAPWEAALGCTVAVPTLGGKVELKIPANSQAGQQLRLKGRGLPGTTSGDHYVVLQIVIPQANSETAKACYRQMAKDLAFNPRVDW
jgi:curved DNA-binding protein